ncbi:unnamed protein product [Gongylonema pulchrum]|uniref:DUF1534 domain-containing protein n=1 Tax=Gongylonema pulchrum TaxID=637853 RepID=A0A183D802_9BILA|nr:unnamed protein product [Gongylonema pulchrum]
MLSCASINGFRNELCDGALRGAVSPFGVLSLSRARVARPLLSVHYCGRTAGALSDAKTWEKFVRRSGRVTLFLPEAQPFLLSVLKH